MAITQIGMFCNVALRVKIEYEVKCVGSKDLLSQLASGFGHVAQNLGSLRYHYHTITLAT